MAKRTPTASPRARRPNGPQEAASPTSRRRQPRIRHSRLAWRRKRLERLAPTQPTQLMPPIQPIQPTRPKPPSRPRAAKRADDDLAVEPLKLAHRARGGDPPGDNVSLGWIAARSWSGRPDPAVPDRRRPRARTR